MLNRVCILGFYLSLTGSWFQTLSGSPIPKYLSSTLPGGGGRDIPQQEANRVVPQDGVEFSQLE